MTAVAIKPRAVVPPPQMLTAKPPQVAPVLSEDADADTDTDTDTDTEPIIVIPNTNVL
jgi:hypothetical protein